MRAAFRRSTGGAAHAALGTRGAHLFQLLQLIGGEDFLKLRFHVGFQIGELLFLVVGQVKLLRRTGREQVEAARAVGFAMPPLVSRRGSARRS